MASAWEKAIESWRDVEIAKRSQPRLVQGVQQVATPLLVNTGATNQQSAPPINNGGSKTLLWLGGGLLLLAGAFVMKKKR